MQIRRLHKTTEVDARQKVDSVMEQLAQTQLPAGIKITSLDKTWSQKELRFSLHAKKAFFKTKIEGRFVVTDESIVLDFLVPPIVGSFISEDKIRDIIERMDKSAVQQTDILKLKYSVAEDVVKMLDRLNKS